MDAQRRVARFAADHELNGTLPYRALDLAAETGEIAAELTDSTAYGTKPDEVAVARDELGDALFSLLLLCESLDVDAETALDESLAKYERRIDETGSPGSKETNQTHDRH